MSEAPAQAAALDERYGRSRQRGIDRRLGWGLVGIALAIGIAVLAFGGWQKTNTVESKVVHYTVQGPRAVTIEYQVSAPTQTRVACALEALSKSYATVGWKVFELPPSDQRTRNLSETLITTYEATTGTVRSCWPVERPA